VSLKTMKNFRLLIASLLGAAFVITTCSASAAEQKDQKDPAPAPAPAATKASKAKPYALKTCLVSDEKLGGDMGEPYTFTYKDREIKLCCKDCRKDFDKNPAKFMKKLEAEEKKPKK
jgi:hypothetical protein